MRNTSTKGLKGLAKILAVTTIVLSSGCSTVPVPSSPSLKDWTSFYNSLNERPFTKEERKIINDYNVLPKEQQTEMLKVLKNTEYLKDNGGVVESRDIIMAERVRKYIEKHKEDIAAYGATLKGQ